MADFQRTEVDEKCDRMAKSKKKKKLYGVEPRPYRRAGEGESTNEAKQEDEIPRLPPSSLRRSRRPAAPSPSLSSPPLFSPSGVFAAPPPPPPLLRLGPLLPEKLDLDLRDVRRWDGASYAAWNPGAAAAAVCPSISLSLSLCTLLCRPTAREVSEPVEDKLEESLKSNAQLERPIELN